MRLFILFFSFAMLAACDQSRVKQPKSYDDYFVCKKDKDCIVIPSGCGAPAAINKKFSQAYEVLIGVRASTIRCAQGSEVDWSKLSAECSENMCLMIGIEEQ